MRKLSAIFILLFFTGIIFAQEAGPTWEGLKKQKAKSDADIENPKKAANPKTWLKRAKIYLDAYTFVTGGLYKGMPAKGNGFQNAELLVGKPGKIMKQGDEEIWVYNRKKLYFKNGVLDRWEQTEFIDKDALKKSAEAVLKAVELDKKGTLKDKAATKNLNELVKNNVINEAITRYTQKDFDNAYALMDYGYKLSQLPKNESDTIFKTSQLQYFEGLIAYNAKKYDLAKKHFEQSIKDGYQPGISYHYLADSYAASGDSASFIEKVKEGFNKYPDEEQLIIDLINYYMIRGKADKAIEYIDLAINKNPENPSYYSAKATIYDNRSDENLELYEKYMEKAYEHKKEAFRNRNNPSLKSASQKKRDEALNKALEQMKLYEDNLSEAESLYQKSLEIDPEFFNAAYNIGRVYLKRNAIKAKHADYLLKIYINKDFARAAEYEKAAKEDLKTAAQKFEEALKIRPDDRDLLNVLKRLYFKMRDKENEQRIIERIEKLGAEEQTPGM